MDELRTFEISKMPGTLFREMKVSPVDILALSTQVDFEQFSKTKELIQFSLEHVEVQIGDQWFPVKQPGRDVYMPIGLEKKFGAMNQICNWYMDNVVGEVFTDSVE